MQRVESYRSRRTCGRRQPGFACALGLLVCAAAIVSAHAGVVTDGSLKPAQVLQGPGFSIPAGLGRQVGGNLFHSFSELNLSQGERAIFKAPGAGAPQVGNIFSRVTGGPSSIDGALISEIPGANFFLLNPKGVMFGPNASVDVSGAFAVVTGDHIALADGARFNAAPGPADAVLTSAPAAAFGFLNGTPGPISFEGSDLAGAEGTSATWSLIGGDVTMNSARVGASGVVIRGGRLTMNDSTVEAQTLKPGQGVDVQLRHALRLKNSNIFAVTIGGGGDVSVTASSASVTGAGLGIAAFSGGEEAGGHVRLAIAGELKLSAGGLVQTGAFGAGAGGDIRISAGAVSVTGAALVNTGISASTAPRSTGNGGEVRLAVAGEVKIVAGGEISSDTFGLGAGGDVHVTAQSLRIFGEGLPVFTAISAETQDAVAGGPGGNVGLNIREGIELTGGGQITTATFGPGTGGNIDVTAAKMSITGAGADLFAGVTANSQNPTVGGPAGGIRLNIAGRIDLAAGGQVAVSTAGPGAGGSIDLRAETLAISGPGSGVTAQTTSPFGGGRGGDITIRTGLLQGRDEGAISASTAGSGDGGSISIFASLVDLQGASINADTTSSNQVEMPLTVSDLVVTVDIDQAVDENLTLALIGPDFASIILASGVGGGGSNFRDTVFEDSAPFPIDTGAPPFTGRFQPLEPLSAFNGRPFFGAWALSLTDDDFTDMTTLRSWSLSTRGITVSSGEISVTLPGPGDSENVLSFLGVIVPPAGLASIRPGTGGDIVINARDIRVDGMPGISARSLGGGTSGSVRLNAGTLTLASRGFIGSSNLGSGDAGSVIIEADSGVTLTGRSTITTSAAIRNAGVVEVNSGTRIDLRDESSITASAGFDGGSILLFAPDFIYLIDGTIAAAAGNNGGNISITGPEFLVLDHSIVSANAIVGIGGNIVIDSGFFLQSASAVTASSEQSVQGTINIQSPDVELAGALVTLPDSFIDAATQLREQCAMRLGTDFSSLLVLGRGGVSAAPEDGQTDARSRAKPRGKRGPARQ